MKEADLDQINPLTLMEPMLRRGIFSKWVARYSRLIRRRKEQKEKKRNDRAKRIISLRGKIKRYLKEPFQVTIEHEPEVVVYVYLEGQDPRKGLVFK